MAYRILCIDGGGIRGLLSAVLLKRLAQSIPAFLDSVALFAGTSTGGILTLGLAAGLSLDDLIALYRDHAAQVFDETWLHDLRDVGGLAGARYDNTNLRNLLQGHFGAMRLRDLSRQVLVPAFELDNADDPHHQPGDPRMWKPKFFHNYPGPDSDGEELVLDVAMRTSAAPTYFPVYQKYIDGGVVANNPGMAALAQALDPATGGQQQSDVRLFSLGTGLNPTFLQGTDLDWGMGQWARILVSLMIDGVMGVADYQCARLLGSRYYRLAPLLATPISLDAKDQTSQLIDIATTVDLRPAIVWLNTTFLPA